MNVLHLRQKTPQNHQHLLLDMKKKETTLASLQKQSRKLPISDIGISKGFISAAKALGYTDEKIESAKIAIINLIEHWKEQQYIEVVDVNHSGFRAYGVAKDSNKYPDQYRNLYHVRLTTSPDPLLIIKIQPDQFDNTKNIVKVITMADHSKIFDNKDNPLMKNFFKSIVDKTDK